MHIYIILTKILTKISVDGSLDSTYARLNRPDRQAVQEAIMKLEMGDKKNVLLAVDVFEKRAVWMMSDTQWIMCGGVPARCPTRSVCFGKVSGGIIVTGGWDTENTRCSLQCHYFSVATKHWKKLSNMMTPRYLASAVEIDDMKLMVLGGRNNTGLAVAVCEILDVQRNEWASAAGMPKPGDDVLVAMASGSVFIVPQEKITDRTCITVYYPSADTYTEKARLPDNILNSTGACMVGVRDMVYLFGARGVERFALQYNPADDQWIKLTPPSAEYSWDYGCCAICCAIVRDKNILLCGGSVWCNMIEEHNVEKQEWKILDTCLPFSYRDSCSCVVNLKLSQNRLGYRD